jgi:hypothetical protein
MDEGTTASEAGQGVNGRCGGKESIVQTATSYASGNFPAHRGGNEVLLYTVCHRS